MAEETNETGTTEERFDDVIKSLLTLIEQAASPEVQQAQLILLRRLALEGSVIPARIPAPKNITEVGGYFNLLESLSANELRDQALASILGVAGPNPPAGLIPTSPVLFFASRENHRPTEGGHQPAIPVRFGVRSDFAEATSAALDEIAAHGAALPLMPAPLALPPVSSTGDFDLLRFVGRTLEAVPAVALADPDADPLAVARLSSEAAGAERVVARVLDETAPRAGEVSEQDWTAFRFDAGTGTFVEDEATRKYLDVTPLVNAAGWFRLAPIDTSALANPASWARFVNVSGLVAGVSRYGDELSLLWSDQQIVASSLRDFASHLWDGSAFVA